MKPTRQKCSTVYREQNPGTWPPTAAARATTCEQWLLELSHASPKVLDSQLGSQPHAPPIRPCCPLIYLTWEFGDHTNSHAPTRAARVSVSPLRANNTVTCLPRIEELLLMWHDDVNSVTSSAPRHLADHWVGRLDLDHPDLTREHWLLTWPGSVNFDFCVDLWPKVKIFERAYLAQFFV